MSSYNYAYGYSSGRSSTYRVPSSYYGLSNKCLPRTVAITDNSKFNVNTMVKVYIDVDSENNSRCNCHRNCNCRNSCNCNSNCSCKNCNRNRDCNLLTNHGDPKDIKAFDKNKEICLNKETELEPQGCKSCSVENIVLF